MVQAPYRATLSDYAGLGWDGLLPPAPALDNTGNMNYLFKVWRVGLAGLRWAVAITRPQPQVIHFGVTEISMSPPI